MKQVHCIRHRYHFHSKLLTSGFAHHLDEISRYCYGCWCYDRLPLPVLVKQKEHLGSGGVASGDKVSKKLNVMRLGRYFSLSFVGRFNSVRFGLD